MVLRLLTIPAILALTTASLQALGQTPAEASTPAAEALPPLERVLHRLNQVAVVYSGNALKFTATEDTQVRNYLARGPRAPRKMYMRNVYFYYRDHEGVLHDLRIRKSRVGRLQKTATTLEEMLEAAGDSMTRKKYDVPAYVENAYSWILLFSNEAREQYDYTLEPTESAGQALIRFNPKIPADETWHGTAVVDLESYQIVRAEGLQTPDLRQEEAMRRMLESPEELPVLVDERTFVVRRVSTDFEIVERGLRFPSKAMVLIHRHRVKGSAKSKKQVTDVAARIVQTYKQYRFYDIAVDVDYLSTIEPQSEASAGR